MVGTYEKFNLKSFSLYSCKMIENKNFGNRHVLKIKWFNYKVNRV